MQKTKPQLLRPSLNIGILGGGQLARMLALRGHQLGLEMHILSGNKTDPAAQVCQNWHCGNPKSPKDVDLFLKNIDRLIFESEFLDDAILPTLKASKKVVPTTKLMELIQDRQTQKQWLVDNKLPTASFMKLSEYLNLPHNPFEKGFVLKARRFGYDGLGTWVSKKSSLEDLPQKAFESPDDFIVEAFIPFQRELAITLVAQRDGNVLALPLVETRQEDQRCLWVKGPVEHVGAKKLITQLKRFIKKQKYQGVITFEVFDTGSELIINEVAPRVHNSAHYSWDALSEDQFTLHLKAVIEAPIKEPKTLAPAFAMYNLLGQTTTSPSWELSKDISLHWYGKQKNYQGRKMGHLNSTGETPEKALNKVRRAQKGFKL